MAATCKLVVDVPTGATQMVVETKVVGNSLVTKITPWIPATPSVGTIVRVRLTHPVVVIDDESSGSESYSGGSVYAPRKKRRCRRTRK